MSTPGPGQLLFGFVRHWSRRSAAGDTAIVEQGRLVMATEAVGALIARHEPATVNAVADEIGIDQSGTSRLLKRAIDAGYVTTSTTSTDGRRREATVTPAGHRLLKQAHTWQEQIFDELTTHWSSRQREDFRTAMADLTARSHEIDV